MRLPSHLSRFEAAIKEKLSEFEGRLTFDSVVGWASQFNNEDQALALTLFIKLKYFTSEDVRSLCVALFSRLPEEVRRGLDHALFVGLGGASDSGSMLLYHYRVSNNLPQANFVDLDGLHALLKRPQSWIFRFVVFIDDFIGTGGQAVTLLSIELKETLASGRFEYVCVQALVGFMDGIKQITEATMLDVVVIHQLTERDKVFHEASQILTLDYFDLQRFRDATYRYGERLYRAGPLGYGGTQALIAFHYNTPNNTLPIIWAAREGWKALLPRIEAKRTYEPTHNEKLVVIYLATLSGNCLLQELVAIAPSLDIDLMPTLHALQDSHLVRIKDAEYDNILSLTAKGLREAHTLFETDQQLVLKVLHEISRRLQGSPESDPKVSREGFSMLEISKQRLVHVIETACEVRDVETVLMLQRTISWILLKDYDIEERIRLGELVLQSFDRQSLGSQFGYTNVDDLGWSYVVNERYDKASKYIAEGIRSFAEHKDLDGLCQGWRHLQAIKGRKGSSSSAALGLRLVFGASCAIPIDTDRLRMQAGILRGLALVASRMSCFDAREDYLEKSVVLSQLIGDEYHAMEELKRIQASMVHLPLVSQEPDVNFTLFLVRHPVTMKNERQTFGRQMLTQLPGEGQLQSVGVGKALSTMLPSSARNAVEVFAGTSKATHLLAAEIATQLGQTVVYDDALDSINSGDLTGYTESEARQYFPDLMDNIERYRKNEFDGFAVEFPGGESVRDLTVRLSTFLLEKVFTGQGPRCCILVGHNSSITAILNIVTAIDRWPIDPSYRYFDVPLGSITRVIIDHEQYVAAVERYGGSYS